MDRFLHTIQDIYKSTNLAILGDSDTGFDDIAQVVSEYSAAGASSLHLEDKFFPKRCGHLVGKQLLGNNLSENWRPLSTGDSSRYDQFAREPMSVM